MNRRVVVLALCLAAAAASAASTSAARSAGCDAAAAPGSQTLSLHGRTVVVHVPRSYTGKSPSALVLNLHGSGSDATQQEAFTGLDATSDAHGFLVAYPQGAIPEGTGFDWNVPGAPLVGGRKVPAGSPDDVAFVTKLVGELEQRYCIDPRRVYATGFSGGARLTSQLACSAASVFAAVAPLSGLRHPAACKPSRPVPILSFHGTADPVDPYGGHGESYWPYSVPTVAHDWGAQERCTGQKTTRPAAGVTVLAYSGCVGGSTVELYSISGEGHEWPGGPRLPRRYTAVLGPQSNAIDADGSIWAFFAAHRLP